MRYDLPKRERIHLREEVRALFASKESFVTYPFRIVYRWAEAEERTPTKILISVPKRRQKRAVDRNRIKRVTREAYRLQKHQLWEQIEGADATLHIGFIYISTTIHSYDTIYRAMSKALTELAMTMPMVEEKSEDQ